MDHIAFKKKYYADAKNTFEMARFKKDDGILLLPVGCFEMHGPQASMSCDTFIAEAACCIMAELWENALILPPIHYAYPGASANWPGTIDISPEITAAYIKEVVLATMKTGFKKLVLVNIHFPNRPNLAQVVRSVFRDTDLIPLVFEVNYGAYNAEVRKHWDQPHGEALMMLSSLYIIGRHGQWDPELKEGEQALPGPEWPTETAFKLKQHGVEFGYHFLKPENHVGRYPGMTLADAEKGAGLMKEVISRTAAGLPEHYQTFIDEMKKAREETPWDNV